MQPHPQSPAHRVLRALPTVARTLAAVVRESGGELDLSMAQLSTLRLLADHDCPAGEVARRLRVSMPTVTTVADGLVGKGLVRRFTPDEDRRQVRLQITPSGNAVLERCLRAVEARLEEALAPLPPEQRQRLAEAAEQLLAVFREVRIKQ